ncbi:unnamed protein product, partial [Mesorhabditis belari]|uniref:Uncharacterized protein n=1 Tax=Mesorhabditis belari TaxID=2138241 RepID=A0AAF3F340_9BILA
MVYKTPKIMLYYKPTLIYHQMLTPGSKLQLSNSSKHLFFLFLHLFAVIPPPLAMYIVAEWNDPKKMISDMNSLVLDVFEKEPLRVYAFAHDDIGPKVVVCAYVLTATTFVSLSGTLVFLTINGTRRFTKSFSASTKKSQREFMITTSVHYTVFIMFLYGGLGVLISPLITGIIDQRTNYYGLIIIAMNSIVSAPIQIFACKAYREFTMKFFKPELINCQSAWII